VRSQDGTSGAYFVTLIERLGIADKLRACIILAPSGRVAELVARGEAEIAVQQISELSPVVGADFADPLPPELQHYTIFCAGLAEASQMSDVARRLIDLIVTPAAAALMKTLMGSNRRLRCKVAKGGESSVRQYRRPWTHLERQG
jgi:molybdate transport system substrate-binding protein